MKHFSIKTRATFLVTGGFVALLALVSSIEMFRVQNHLGKVLAEQQLAFVSRLAVDIDEKLRSAHGALIARAKATDPGMTADPARLHADLADRLGLQSLFDGLYVISRDGRFVVELPAVGAVGRSVADREYFQDTVRERRPLISRPYVTRLSKVPVIMLTAPVLDERGEVAAVLAGTLNLLRPNFLGAIGTASVGKTGQLALLGRDRTIIVSRDRERVMTAGPAPGVSPYFDRAVSGAEGWEENVNSRGLHALFSYSQLKAVPWVLVAALPVEEAYAPIATARTHIAGVTLVLIVVLAPLVWFGTAHLIAPLIRLRDAIRGIRADPSRTSEVEVRGTDEISDLATDFNVLMRERDAATAALRDSAHRLNLIADNIPALISYIDSGERYRYANATYGEWFGAAPGDILGRTVREVVGEAGYALRAPHIRQALAGREAAFSAPVAVGDAVRHMQVRYVPDFREDGSVAGFYILASDVTGLKHTEEMLRDSRRQLSLALEGSQLALFDWNVVTGEVFLGERWATMLGGSAQQTQTTFAALEELVHPEDRELVGARLRDVLKGASSHYRVEHRVRTDDGRWLWIQSHGQVTEHDEAGRARRMLGTNADITERKRAERELAESRAELERAALYDSLTGLPNRRLLEDRMQLALARARRGRQIIAVMCLDLDLFKTINDTQGHAGGDTVLKEFAARLNACARASDTAARLGGDEFVVLLEDLHRPDDVRVLAEKIIDAMAEKFRVGAEDLSVTTSIGIACSGGTETCEEVLLRADAALYEAKRAGRNRFHVAASALYVVSDNAPATRTDRT